MRVTEKRFPILRYLKWPKPLREHPDYRKYIPIFAPSMEDLEDGDLPGALKTMFEEWPLFCSIFAHEIDVVSCAFLDAANANRDKIMTRETCKMLAGQKFCGTLLYEKRAICYGIEFFENGTFMSNIFVMHDGAPICASNHGGTFITKWASPELLANLKKRPPAAYFSAIPILFHLFKRYAEVETIDAKPFKKVEIPSEDDPEKKDTLLVDSDLPIKYTDCSWFRTIVRKEGFMVRGHFRLQPCKNQDGEWDHKLIYIEPYQKHGYTRTAKKVVKQRKGE